MFGALLVQIWGGSIVPSQTPESRVHAQQGAQLACTRQAILTAYKARVPLCRVRLSGGHSGGKRV